MVVILMGGLYLDFFVVIIIVFALAAHFLLQSLEDDE
jgi:hypothetical protein